MRKSDMQRNKGFSMMELMITLAIMAIISTIAYFSWVSYITNANLKAAAADMVADLMLMKERARSDTGIGGTTYTITFNLDNNNYTMTGTGSKTPASFAQDIRIFSISLALLGTITSGSTTITCQTRGTLSPISGNIVLRNKRGSTATITYNVTGRTYVTYVTH